jgi:protein O-mannosyl-transferase
MINRLSPSYGQPDASHCRKVVFAFITLAAIIFIIYGNSFDCSWHFDDEPNIVDNPNLHLREFTWENIKQALYSDRNRPTSLYRPVACLSFAINHYFGGLNVFGYHLVNISVHFISSVFLFLFIYHTLNLPSLRLKYAHNSYFIALLAVVLWSINPIQTQAVTYIVQRMAGMAGMFYIIGMYLYLKFRTADIRYQKVLYFILCFFFTLMALGSKENAAILPLSLFVYEILLLREITAQNLRKTFLVFFVVTGTILILGFSYIYSQGGNIFAFLDGYGNRPFTLAQRLLTEPRIIIYYISLLLYPVSTRLNVAHSIDTSSSLFHPFTTPISFIAILAAIFFAIYLAKRRPLISFSIIFFFLNHVIESTILPLELIFEHRNYIPSMFFFVPVAMGFCSLIDYYRAKRVMQFIITGFIVFILIGLGHSTFMRNFTWKNEKSLWIDASEKAPDLSRPHHNLGRYYGDHGQKEEAIIEYKTALQKPVCNRKGESFVTCYNLGMVYGGLKNYEKALLYYNRALALNSYFPPVYNNMASLMEEQGKHELAHKYLVKGIKLNLYSPELFVNLGLYYLKMGEPDRAIFWLKKAENEKHIAYNISLDLGIAYKQKGLYGRAVIYFKNALKYGPRNITPHLHLAEVFYRADDHKQAKQETKRIIRLTQGKEMFDRIMHDLSTKDRSSKIRPCGTILIPMLRDEYLRESETLKEWGELLDKKDLLLKGKLKE